MSTITDLPPSAFERRQLRFRELEAAITAEFERDHQRIDPRPENFPSHKAACLMGLLMEMAAEDPLLLAKLEVRYLP